MTKEFSISVEMDNYSYTKLHGLCRPRSEIARILSVVNANIFRLFIWVVFDCMKTEAVANCQGEIKSKKRYHTGNTEKRKKSSEYRLSSTSERCVTLKFVSC